MTPHEIAVRLVHPMARVVSYCSPREADPSKCDHASRAGDVCHLARLLDEWHRHLPIATSHRHLPIATYPSPFARRHLPIDSYPSGVALYPRLPRLAGVFPSIRIHPPVFSRSPDPHKVLVLLPVPGIALQSHRAATILVACCCSVS